jgi:hypothetical protein
MQTIDFAKEHRELYHAGKKVQEIDAQRASYLRVKGKGAPGAEAFQRAIEALYSVGYTLKFQLKHGGELDFKVPKLECLYDLGDAGETPPDQWEWRLQLRIPDQITADQVRAAKSAVKAKGQVDPADVRRTSWKEGRAVQVMHVGPYDQVGTSYRLLKETARELGYRERGPCHEIYISDPRRTAPEKLKTIVRMPISHSRPSYARGRAQ